MGTDKNAFGPEVFPEAGLSGAAIDVGVLQRLISGTELKGDGDVGRVE